MGRVLIHYREGARMSMMMPPGGPLPGPMGAPPMGAPMAPPPPQDPVAALSAAAAGMQQQVASQQAAASGAMMILAQMLGDQASPEAQAAQTSPGPLGP